MAKPVLHIQMQEGRVHGGACCCNCGMECDGAHGLPMFEGEIVPLDWAGEWAGVDCCAACHDRHQMGIAEFAMPGPWRPIGFTGLKTPAARWRRSA